MRTLLPAPPSAGPSTRLRRAATIGIAGVVVLAVLSGIALAGMRLARTGVLPGVVVGGLDVGGHDEAQLRAAVAGYAQRRHAAPVSVVLGDTRVSGTAVDAGYRLDTEATVRAALRRGRQPNPVAALADQVRAFRGTLSVAPVHRIDTATFEGWVGHAVEALSQHPVEGGLKIDGAQITRVDPRPGIVVRDDGLRDALRAALLDTGEGSEGAGTVVRARGEQVQPETDAADVDAVLASAQRAVSAPVALTRQDVRLDFSPEQIGALLAVTPADGELHLQVDADRLADVVGADTIDRLETEAADAAFVASGGTVRITPSREGFRFDPQVAAAQLLAVATSDGPREVALDGEVVAPALSTHEAQELGIRERVSTFTTEFTAGQSRVTNIRRIAELVDGVLLRPGETLSVNDHVGPRTTEKGFVGGGAIFDGEFVEQIGGGVSQFATTMYNAAYFGGYAIPAHKAHSYYISRYPVGREATLNYPNVDLKVTNNSPYGALVKTSSTPTSVTVSFYGTRWVDVETVAGPRTNVVPPPVEVRPAGDLPPGAERVVQEGREGFDITVTRILTFPDGRVDEEREFTRYLPEPRIVERGPES